MGRTSNNPRHVKPDNPFRGILRVGALIAVLTTTSLHAQSLINNGTFESPVFSAADTYLPVGSTALPGWTVAGGEISIHNDLFNLLPAVGGGHQYLDVTGLYGYDKGILSGPILTVPGQLYEVSFDLGVFYSDINYGDAAVDVSFNGVFAGTWLNENTLTVRGTDWERMSFIYQAVLPTTTIELLGSHAGGNAAIGVDNISFVAVPVPGGLVLSSLGIGLVHCLRRRRTL